MMTLQVNLLSCCVVPEELSSYAKENDIKLLTHSDPEIMLDQASLSEIEQSRFVGLTADYVVRYQVMDPDRGVLLDKRYIVCLNAEEEKK